MITGKVLIIDDEPGILRSFGLLLKQDGHDVRQASTGAGGLALLAKETCDLVLLDFAMPEMDGLAVLREIRRRYPELVVIMITGYGEVSLVVEAVKEGAYDYLLKPPEPDHLLMTIRRALEKKRLEQQVGELDRSLMSSLETRLGKSAAMARVIADIKLVAASDFSLVIEGETGTGKTFIASLIHNLSPRAAAPFIALDMGSIPESLLESELFGHQKGAFTGADRPKKGYFELAQGGTLLLDELQNLSTAAQAKILQVVEEKRFYPVGGTKPVIIDLRLIGATNSNLVDAVEAGNFRRDLFYRLNEYRIVVPPLRQRPEDIAFLASRLLVDAATELNRNFSGITEAAVALLMDRSWQGNIRELKNILRRATLLSTGGEIDVELLQQVLNDDRDQWPAAGTGAATEPGIDSLPPSVTAGQTLTAPVSLEVAEKAAIARALRHTGGNRTKTAAILGITHKTLLTKIKKYHLG